MTPSSLRRLPFFLLPQGQTTTWPAPDESGSNKPNIPTTSTPSARELMTRIRNKKALAQRRNIPVLRPAPALENEEDGGDELDADDDDAEKCPPKAR